MTSSVNNTSATAITLNAVVQQSNRQTTENVSPVFVAPNKPKIATNVAPRDKDRDALPVAPTDPIAETKDSSFIQRLLTSDPTDTTSNTTLFALNTSDVNEVNLDPTAPLNSNTINALVQLTALLIGLQIIVNGLMASNNLNQTHMQKNQIDASLAAAASTKLQIQKMEDEKNKVDVLGWAIIALQLVAAVATFVVDPVGSTVMLTMASLQIAEKEGAMSDSWTGSALGDGFLKFGLSLAAAGGAGYAAGKFAGNAATQTALKAGKTAEEAQAAGSAASSTAGKSSAAMAGTMSVAVLNPTSDFMTASGASDSAKQIGQIISQITLILLTLKAGMMAGSSGTNLLSRMTDPAGAANLTKLLYTFNALANMGSAGSSIAIGKIQMDQADILDQMAETSKDTAILKSLGNNTQTNIENYQEWEKNFNNSLSGLNSLFSQLMQAQAEAAQILG